MDKFTVVYGGVQHCWNCLSGVKIKSSTSHCKSRHQRIKLWNSWDWPRLITSTFIRVTCGVSTYESTPSIATSPAPNYSDSANCYCTILTNRKRHQSVREHRVSLYQIFSHLRVKEKTEKHKNRERKQTLLKILNSKIFRFVPGFSLFFFIFFYFLEYLSTTTRSGKMNDLTSIHRLQLLF